LLKLARQLPKLESLNVPLLKVNTLEPTNLTDQEAELIGGCFPSLRSLTIKRGSRNSEGSVISLLAEQTKLESLTIDYINLSPAVCSTIAQDLPLTLLSLKNCQLTDDTVDTLTSKLTKLTVLKLSGNKIGPIACRFITERLHQLEVLHLESNSLC